MISIGSATKPGAVQIAREQPGVSVISMSFGEPEIDFGSAAENWWDTNCFTTPSGHRPITFVAASGDTGVPGGYPAYSPNVLAVGGTDLTISNSNQWSSEAPWNDLSGETGGGISQYEGEPACEEIVQTTNMREMPDVAFEAGLPGVRIVDSVPYVFGSATPVEGTSIGAPCWAGLVAITNQACAIARGQSVSTFSLDGPTQILPSLYGLYSSSAAADFHAMTLASGTTNSYVGEATGLGSPIVNNLIPGLVGAPTVTTLTASTQQLSASNPTLTVTVAFNESMNAATLPQFSFPNLPAGDLTLTSDSWTANKDNTVYTATYTVVSNYQTAQNVQVTESGAQSAVGISQSGTATWGQTITIVPSVSVYLQPNPSVGANTVLSINGFAVPGDSVHAIATPSSGNVPVRLSYAWYLNGALQSSNVSDFSIPSEANGGCEDVVTVQVTAINPTNGSIWGVATSTARATVFGDASLDGTVDITDITILLAHFGQSGTWTQGAMAPSTPVGVADLTGVLTSYNSVITVPAPSDGAPTVTVNLGPGQPATVTSPPSSAEPITFGVSFVTPVADFGNGDVAFLWQSSTATQPNTFAPTYTVAPYDFIGPIYGVRPQYLVSISGMPTDISGWITMVVPGGIAFASGNSNISSTSPTDFNASINYSG